MRIAVGIEYDGSRFAGWQSQQALRTVQQVLEDALGAVAAQPVSLVAAGRTDAGVHARAQVAHFDTDAERSARAWVLGTNTDFGIGVSAGRAIAGHIGAQARFEYTVIGDPVNEAARLTELAKLEEGHVLASAIAVSGALDAEALCWDVGEVVELRGRTAPTQLARPLNLAAPQEITSEATG